MIEFGIGFNLLFSFVIRKENDISAGTSRGLVDDENRSELVQETVTSSESEKETLEPEVKKSYKQKFKNEWVGQFGTWLKSDEQGKASYCEVCKISLKGGITHIDSHSNMHQKHLKSFKAKPLTMIDKLLINMEEQQLARKIKSMQVKMIMFLA